MRFFKQIKSLRNYDSICLPNYTSPLAQAKEKKRRIKEKKKYGYALAETYSLDYTAAIWLYEHIKMLLEEGGKIVDFECEHGWSDYENKIFDELGIAPINDKEALEQVCTYIESALEIDGLEEEYYERLRKGFLLWTAIMPRAWW